MMVLGHRDWRDLAVTTHCVRCTARTAAVRAVQRTQCVVKQMSDHAKVAPGRSAKGCRVKSSSREFAQPGFPYADHYPIFDS
jgi:hypothetical protein